MTFEIEFTPESIEYYESFTEFKTAITQCIERANDEQRAALSSLLTWNFQSFRKESL
uniref:Uncharacterized protein n=1 Tax=Candidatus Kentrum sp. LPFa TaxID=2126335 RepID=A0A450WB35_9GAMM|nr:MAG: hypothetical protein BECKLPF1236B_GA0070989_105724 [Candidatus Kentron sp. LPFa]